MSGALFSCSENGRYVLYEQTDTINPRVMNTKVFDTQTGRLYFQYHNNDGTDYNGFIDFVDEAEESNLATMEVVHGQAN